MQFQDILKDIYNLLTSNVMLLRCTFSNYLVPFFTTETQSFTHNLNYLFLENL